MRVSSAVNLLAPCIMLVALSDGSLPLATAALCLTGISFGTNPTISAAFIGSFYGMKHYAVNYGISNSKLMFSSFAATFASGLLAATGSYTAPFLMLSCLAALSFVLCLLIIRP